MERALTYVYCLVAAPRKPLLKAVPPGPAGLEPPRLLDLDNGQWLVVSDAPANQYSEQAINRRLGDLQWVGAAAVAHEAVIESFARAPAVLPMKLFTIFLNDERARLHVAGQRRRINTLLKRVTGHQEWGVRVRLDRAAAARKIAPGRRTDASGAGYLSRKLAQREAATELAGRAQTAVATLYDRLTAVAGSAKRRAATELPAGGGPLLLDAAFLVAKSRAARFRALVRRQAQLLGRHGYQLELTGPWPPYTFIQD